MTAVFLNKKNTSDLEVFFFYFLIAALALVILIALALRILPSSTLRLAFQRLRDFFLMPIVCWKFQAPITKISRRRRTLAGSHQKPLSAGQKGDRFIEIGNKKII